VLEAALQMVDEGGIESLSMRKLGQSLGVAGMALYNHVANKDEILSALVEMVLTEFELPSTGDDWQAAIWRLAISAHEALLRHPWACNLILSSILRPGQLRYMESIMRILRDAGFSREATYHAYHTIDSHILGFTLWQLGHGVPADAPPITSKEDLLAFAAKALPWVSADDYPHLLEHAELHLSEGSHKDEDEFEFGLRLILEGLTKMRGRS
jgi:AcrR family transcriptional regulator